MGELGLLRALGALGVLGNQVALQGCASTATGPIAGPIPDPADGSDERSSGQAMFFDAHTGEPLSGRNLTGRVEAARLLLLGEVHDNGFHHRLRARMLLKWARVAPGRPAAIVFEHFDREHDEALRLAQRRPKEGQGTDARLTALLDAADFDRQSWEWPTHQPLFEAALTSGATWIAANLSRDSAQRLGGNPAMPVDPALQAMVDSARWSAEAQQALAQALIVGHCGTLSAVFIDRIARIQRLRDAALALPLMDASERRSVLLAGNGHVRRDFGVPRYLGALEKEAVVVGFDEVAQAEVPAREAARVAARSGLAGFIGDDRARELGEAYDLVCLTTARKRDDRCSAVGVQPLSPAVPMQTP